MTTFGLIHGAWHGAWCWDHLVAELEARGHQAIAVELPADDVNAGIEEYVATALAAFAATDDDLVVVGHSLGGLTAAVVAARRPVRHLVYLCALVPEPGQPLSAIASDAVIEGFGVDQISHEDGSSEWRTDSAVASFYHDCDPAAARWAAGNLRRQAWKVGGEPIPIEAHADVPTTSVLCVDERAISPTWSRAAAARIGARVVELPGGHSPFLSRPAALADVLTTV